MFKRTLLMACAALLAAACNQNNHSSPNNPPPSPPSQPQGNANPPAGSFTKIASFDGQQVTGVTVVPAGNAAAGRVFANFPRWRDGVANSVVEVLPDGSSRPYPDANWNSWKGLPGETPEENKFVCVQSVVAHGNSLFVLDPSSPEIKGVVGRPMLYEFDLGTNQLSRKWTFDEKVAPPRSYLNDLRFDEDGQHVYITESGLGAIIVLDLQSGQARRLLDQRPSTKTEPITLQIENHPFVKSNGLPNRFNADGIALNKDYLYYHAVTGYHLYRVPTSALKDVNLAEPALAAKVEDLGKTPAPDGMIFDPAGNLYMADLEHNAIVYRTPDGTIKTLVQDPNIHWADTFALDNSGNLLFTDSRLGEAGPGQPAAGKAFTINRIPLAGAR